MVTYHLGEVLDLMGVDVIEESVDGDVAAQGVLFGSTECLGEGKEENELA